MKKKETFAPNARYMAELLLDRIVTLRQDWELGDTNDPETSVAPDEEEIPDVAVQIYELFSVVGMLERLRDDLLREKIPEEDFGWVMNHLPDPELEFDPNLDGPLPESMLESWDLPDHMKDKKGLEKKGLKEKQQAYRLEIEKGNDRLRAWSSLALSVLPDWEVWRKGAKVLEESYEKDWEPQDRATLARRLLSDLDDADLVCEMVADLLDIDDFLAQKDQDLLDGTWRQVEWAEKRGHLFVAAGAYAVAMAESIDEEAGMGTVDKFYAVCEAVDEARDMGLISERPALDGVRKRAIQELALELKEKRAKKPEPAVSSPQKDAVSSLIAKALFGPAAIAAAATQRDGKKGSDGPLLEFVGEAGWTASVRLPGPAQSHDHDVVKVWIDGLEAPLSRVYFLGIESTPNKKTAELWVAEYVIGALRKVAGQKDSGQKDSGQKDSPALVLETESGDFLPGTPRGTWPDQ